MPYRSITPWSERILTPDQLRTASTVVAGATGAGVGLTIGMTYRLFASGNRDLAILTAVLTVLLLLALGFLVLQARVVAQLVEQGTFYSHAAVNDLDRRIGIIEGELAQVERRTAPPAPR